jgi:uncharacterized membrane protein
MLRTTNILFFVLASLCAPVVHAQEVHQELQSTERAEVVKILAEQERAITGTDATALVQTVTVRLRSGDAEGELVTFDNDLVELKRGDHIFVNHLITIDGHEYYEFKDVDRRFSLLWLGVAMAALLILFSGRQGARALVSLFLSIGVILFALAPALLAGYPPIATSVVVAGVTLALILFLTHGINARTTIAFCGTFGAVLITGVCATFWVGLMRFTGFGADAAIYLNFSTGGALDFPALLLAGIIIGMLGVLDDVAITQSSVVQELKAANDTLGFKELYRRAIRVGRDHVASLVNTLAFAYVGAALPLILLLARTDAPFGLMINQEIVAAEIVRIIVGSIGLILAVPLTTVAAAWWYAKRDVERTDHHGHVHGS